MIPKLSSKTFDYSNIYPDRDLELKIRLLVIITRRFQYKGKSFVINGDQNSATAPCSFFVTRREGVLSDFVGNFLREDVDAVVFQGAVGMVVAGNYQPCSLAPSLPSGQFISKTFYCSVL